MSTFIYLSMFSIGCGIVAWMMQRHLNSLEQANIDKNDSMLRDFKSGMNRKIMKHTFLFSSDYQEIAIRYDGQIRSNGPIMIKIKDLVSCDLVCGNSVVKQYGIGRAVVGGMLAGNAGAIVGATTAKQKQKIDNIDLKFYTNDIHNPIIKITVYTASLDGTIYANSVLEQCDELIATINLLLQKQ